MKKFLSLVLFSIVLLSHSHVLPAQNVASVTALGSGTASGQVTCGTTATLIPVNTTGLTPAGNPYTFGRLSVTFQNQSAQPVYIAPCPNNSCLPITTSNAGILLGTQYSSWTSDRTTGNVAWYCITGSSTATVGWTEER